MVRHLVLNIILFLFLLQSDSLSTYVACHRYCYGILWRKRIVSFFLFTLYTFAFSKWISELTYLTFGCLLNFTQTIFLHDNPRSSSSKW
jgi:hypothetical protein